MVPRGARGSRLAAPRPRNLACGPEFLSRLNFRANASSNGLSERRFWPQSAGMARDSKIFSGRHRPSLRSASAATDSAGSRHFGDAGGVTAIGKKSTGLAIGNPQMSGVMKHTKSKGGAPSAHFKSQLITVPCKCSSRGCVPATDKHAPRILPTPLEIQAVPINQSMCPLKTIAEVDHDR